MNNYVTKQRVSTCVKGIWGRSSRNTSETSSVRLQTKPVGRALGSWMGFIFQQPSAEVQFNSGLHYKKWEIVQSPWKSKQWKRDFPGVVLGKSSKDSKMGGAWLVSGGRSIKQLSNAHYVLELGLSIWQNTVPAFLVFTILFQPGFVPHQKNRFQGC